MGCRKWYIEIPIQGGGGAMNEIALPTYAQSQQILERVNIINADVYQMKSSVATIYNDVHGRRSIFSEEVYLPHTFSSDNPAEILYVSSTNGGIFGGVGKLDDDGVKVNIVLEVDGVDIDMIRIGGGLDSFIYFPVPFKESLVVKGWTDGTSGTTPLSVFIFA